MMPLPTPVIRTAAQVTRLISPTLLSVFLETRHCRRMSVGKYGTGNSNPRPSDVQLHARTQTPKMRNVNAAQPGEGRRRRVSKVEKEETLGNVPNEMSSSQSQPRSSLKKYRREKNSTLVKEPKQLSVSSESTNQVERDGILSSQTRNPGHGPYDEKAEEAVVFRRATRLTKPSFIPNPLVEGISGRAAAIAYLRIRGLANRGRQKTFYAVLAWILRHAARDLGFEIVPDGFVRISDLLRFELFQRHTLETFAKACVDDVFDRFEVISLPDVVNGEMREVWWARARACQTIPGVHASNKRIINMGRLQTVVYRAPFADWPTIRKYGILEDPDRLIRIYQTGAVYFRNIIPRNAKYICITIDAQKAADSGVMFFHTQDVELLAVSKNGCIPFKAIRSVVELEVKKENLI